MFSIAIIITIIIAFANMIIDTFDLNTISFTQNSIINVAPTHIQLNMSPLNNNMIGINLKGYDLNQENRLFDVYAYQTI